MLASAAHAQLPRQSTASLVDVPAFRWSYDHRKTDPAALNALVAVSDTILAPFANFCSMGMITEREVMAGRLSCPTQGGPLFRHNAMFLVRRRLEAIPLTVCGTSGDYRFPRAYSDERKSLPRAIRFGVMVSSEFAF